MTFLKIKFEIFLLLPMMRIKMSKKIELFKCQNLIEKYQHIKKKLLTSKLYNSKH